MTEQNGWELIGDKQVVNDAYWQIRSIDYIDQGPQLKTSLFDDPKKLEDDWKTTIDTLRAEAQLPPERQASIIKKAEGLLSSLASEAARAASPEAAKPDLMEARADAEPSRRRFTRFFGRTIRHVLQPVTSGESG